MVHSLQQSVSGVELWRGPSAWNGDPVVVIATLDSSNGKTGNMVQTWILRQDMYPLDAVKTGQDDAICGACPHRGTVAQNGKGRTCYVNVGQGPRNIWKTWMAGKYPAIAPEQFASVVRGREVRLGAYGDPAMVPAAVWDTLVAGADGHTGYTHQWRQPFAQNLRTLCMASVDSPAEAAGAALMGWRTFRVRGESDPVLAGEVVCPASPEGGRKTNCLNCLLCRGADPAKPGLCKGIVIIDHGPLSPQAIRARVAGARAARERKQAQTV